MSKATRIKQAIRITVISTLVFYFGLIALLNLPAVQHRISTYAARELTRLTQAEVSIGNVDLGLLNRVVIQNVQIKDRQKKDMLGISRFSVKIDIPSLLRGKIRISSVQLFGLDARLNRAHPKAPLNCQFLIDTFASKDTTKSEKSIDLRINSVLIRRGQIHYDVLSESNTPRRFNPNPLRCAVGIQHAPPVQPSSHRHQRTFGNHLLEGFADRFAQRTNPPYEFQ